MTSPLTCIGMMFVYMFGAAICPPPPPGVAGVWGRGGVGDGRGAIMEAVRGVNSFAVGLSVNSLALGFSVDVLTPPPVLEAEASAGEAEGTEEAGVVWNNQLIN